MFSFPLFERLKAEMPEFEEVTAFQAGRRAPQRQAAGRRYGVAGRCAPSSSPATTSRRSASAAFGGRVFTPADDTPAAPPAVVLSHHVWQGTYGGDPSVVGATLVRRRAPIHGRRRHAAGILRRDAARRSAAICGFRCSRNR